MSEPLSRAGDAKSGAYYANARVDLLTALPQPLGAVLDVGCGEGAAADLLHELGASRITGVEPHGDAARAASGRYDEVIAATVEDAFATLAGPFDTILLYDVLEHLVDPAGVLEQLRSRAAPGARVQVSVPNARHLSLVWDLIVRGTFGYSEWGHRDSTHLRWFTRRDIVALLEATGWAVRSTSHPALHRARLLDKLSGGRTTEFLVGQWYVLAVRAD
jgi:2-polyprenyl-3-methyl-5-hydroxy-6-metoxy-1,4-benzoquinol methylase